MTLIEQVLFIGRGVIVTLKYTLSALAVGLSVGMGLAILRRQILFRWLVDSVVSLIRGTPLLLQLSFFYFAVPGFLGIRLDIWHAGLIAFGLNSAAYVTEIFRSGIQSVAKGQFEAAKSLQIPTLLLWKDIIIPQVLRNIFPALVNEIISLIKETAIISMFGELDIMRRAQVVAASQFNYFEALCLAAVYYYSLIFIIERVTNKIEKTWYAKY
ncbi:MAG: amino acid ABC transporter permease [Gammaproteobacteria bacterium]|jgi:polar amino acid transport system permease protein